MIHAIVSHAAARIFAASSQVNCPLGSGSACATGLPTTQTTGALSTALTLAFGVIGVISVVMVVIGGFQFVMSQGDPQATAKARMTIIYAIVGLAVAISAEAIVAFVLNKF
jgi:hypothetical protein